MQSKDSALVPILVTDGDQRASLALVRSLGRRGHRVFVAATRPNTIAAASRFARGFVRVPDALAQPREYVETLRSEVRRLGIGVLIPTTEASLLAVLDDPGFRDGVIVPFPDAATFRSICDKAAVLSRADAIGIAVPDQILLESAGSIAGAQLEALDYPIVVKPGRSIGERAGQRTKLTVMYADDAAGLRRLVDALPEAAFPVLLQQRITGPGIGIFLLRWNGQTLATFAHRRIREKPPSGGVSVYRESVEADPALVRLSTELLEGFGWNGVAMVEYKVDARTDTPYLMEVNGRFWGSLQLAIDAGVDFPSLLVAAALGDRVTPVTDYRTGVRSRWWWGDVDQLITTLRRRPGDPALPPEATPRKTAVAEFMKLWQPGDRYEILRLDDPAPFLRETLDWFIAIIASRRRA